MTLAVVLCVMAPTAIGAAISQGYPTDGSVTSGMLVSTDGSKNLAVPADTTNATSLLGVAVPANASSLAINDKSSLLQVAVSGTAQAFVSDINGPIHPGDQITPSPLEGIGMKATNSSKVIGVAQSSFDGSKASTTSTVKTADGKSHQVHIGTVTVVVQVGYYTAPSQTAVPAYLQEFIQTVTGKTVSVARLVVVGVILIIAIIIVAFLMYAAVRGAVVSIGRNPLAKASIYKGMLQAAAVSVAILGAAVAGAFIVLRY